jgi:hypothetical protein
MLILLHQIYRPYQKAPKVPKDQDCSLRHVGGDDWEVQCDEQDVATGTIRRHINGAYKFHDLRISIVYRARCFESDSQAQQYRATHGPGKEASEYSLSVDQILDVFKSDLVSSHKTQLSRSQLDSMDRLDLALLLMDTYVHYPLPMKKTSWFPYNYCAVPLLFPKLEPIFDLICK